MADAPGVGWVRGNLAATETILTQLNEVRNEVERLRSENQKLIDDAKPKIDDIAGLDESFRIKFSYYSRSSKERYDSQIDLSWSQKFTIIGPAFLVRRHQRKLTALWTPILPNFPGSR
jgi:hypothetical protein